MAKRFTIDGGEALEAHLAETCDRVRAGVAAIVPPARLEALVLGGGYGRGQGGVWRQSLNSNQSAPERPYNDLEFYVFARGPRLLSERRYREPLDRLGEQLSPNAGLHVEFKVDSLARLRHSPVTMFSYDLVAGHRVLAGAPPVFAGCEHHLEASKIPLSEASRLLFNRCTGLLLAKEKLSRGSGSADDLDFVWRNIAKAKLALGDVLLTVAGQYHWSVLERKARLEHLPMPEPPDWKTWVLRHYASAVAFKLHPHESPAHPSAAAEHEQISKLAAGVWVWLENHRLRRDFSTPHQYALSETEKCPGAPRLRNYLLNLRRFGPAAAFDRHAFRYPRERLMNTLPFLLWGDEMNRQPEARRRVQEQLRTDVSDWTGLVEVYKSTWAGFG